MSATFTKSEAVLKIFSNDLRYISLAKGEGNPTLTQPTKPAAVRVEQSSQPKDYQREALGLLG